MTKSNVWVYMALDGSVQGTERDRKDTLCVVVCIVGPFEDISSNEFLSPHFLIWGYLVCFRVSGFSTFVELNAFQG